jgi:hypothetical protein
MAQQQIGIDYMFDGALNSRAVTSSMLYCVTKASIEYKIDEQRVHVLPRCARNDTAN